MKKTIAAGALAISLFVVGCGGDKATPTPAPESPGAAVESMAAAAVESVKAEVEAVESQAVEAVESVVAAASPAA